jgi:hypothetical protein
MRLAKEIVRIAAERNGIEPDRGYASVDADVYQAFDIVQRHINVSPRDVSASSSCTYCFSCGYLTSILRMRISGVDKRR